jgi:Zn-dependent protease with chaperone function
MILIAFGLSWVIRLVNPQPTINLAQRWRRSLFLFGFPPLFLLITAVAVVSMGYQGEMLGLKASWLSYLLAICFIFYAIIALINLFIQSWGSLKKISRYPQEIVSGKVARIIKTNFPYIAQIGFWKPELVVSQGLFNVLDEEHLQAVLAHEQAHYYYRDTFSFFWLAFLNSFTKWLPNTEALWQELLLLREIRADRKAAQEVDELLLAESLLIVVETASKSTPFIRENSFCAAFNEAIPSNRLEERIEALLNREKSSSVFPGWSWIWLLFALLPLITLPWHY